LAAGLVFPNDAALTNSYEEMVAYYQAVAEGVRTLRPDLVEELAPSSDRHGVDALPWGRGWLYTKVPSKWSDQQVEVPVTLPPITLTTERHPRDPRSEPALDALLLYLWLTGAWRDQVARDILRPLICFECGYDVEPKPKCPKPVCFAAGSVRPEKLKLRINRIKAPLGVHRARGRPRGSSKWDRGELHIVLSEYVRYRALRKEMAPYF
jgi:hypothetical protein